MSTVDSYSIESYRPHMYDKWRKFYFDIDKFECHVGTMRRSNYSIKIMDVVETIFCEEIVKVGVFLTRIINEGQKDLNGISSGWVYLSPKERDALLRERTLVRGIRSVFMKSNELMRYYELNCFLICKVAKEISSFRLGISSGDHNEPISFWQDTKSHELFSATILSQKSLIAALTSRCSEMMSELCNENFPLVTEGQLKFGQATEIDTRTWRGYLGAKLGFAFALARSFQFI